MTDNCELRLTEDELLLREGRKIVEALGKTLAPLVEVVLHDYTHPEEAVVYIANNLSGRQAGDPVTEIGVARIQDPSFPAVLQNYPNRFPDGRPAKSTSIGLKNSEGVYVGAICLNVDVSLLSSVAASIEQFVQTEITSTSVKESLAPRRVTEVREHLQQFAARYNTSPRALTPDQRRMVMNELDRGGLLNLKSAISEAAETLGVARSTIYTYLPKEMAK